MSAPPTDAGGAAPRWQDLARRAAERRNAEGEGLAVRQLLTFVLDGSPYAVPVERVREIVRIRPITPVPRVPEDVCGVISLRGEILEVIDLRLRLRLRAAPPGRASRIIVVHVADGCVAGLLVDGVAEVLAIPADALRPAASAEAGNVETLCVRGDRFISLIDLERALRFDAQH
jgi:purine-binding chemotaxis protein CheW